jgi:hypothetical protein
MFCAVQEKSEPTRDQSRPVTMPTSQRPEKILSVIKADVECNGEIGRT